MLCTFELSFIAITWKIECGSPFVLQGRREEEEEVERVRAKMAGKVITFGPQLMVSSDVSLTQRTSFKEMRSRVQEWSSTSA
jgi:hypothetical protein